MPIRDYTLNYHIDASGAAQGFAILKAGYTELRTDTNISKHDLAQLERQVYSLGMEFYELGQMMQAVNRTHVDIHSTAGKATSAFGGLNASVIGAAAAFQGLAIAIDTIGELGEKIAQVRQKTVEMAEATMQLRQEMRELANLKGHDGPDDEVVAGTVEFGMQVAMTPKQATQFMSQYLGSNPAGLQKGNIGDGRHADESQEDYEKRVQPISQDIAAASARFGQRVGLSPKTAGDVGGVMSQFTKVQSGEHASQLMGQMAYGLNEGRGNLEPLMAVLANTAGAIVNENGGAVESLPELSVMLGVMSTHHKPTEAGTYLKKAARELRKETAKDGETGDALKALGVTPDMTTMQAMKKIAPAIEQAQAQGVSPDNYFRSIGFADPAGIQALTEVYNDMDLYDTRMEKTQKITGKAVEKQNERYFNVELAGIHQMQTAAGKASEYLKGQEAEKMNMAREAAIIRMRDSGSLNSTDQQLADKAADLGGLTGWVGLPESFQMRVDEEARNTAITQARNAGFDKEADAFEAKAHDLTSGGPVLEASKRPELQRLQTDFFNKVGPKMLEKGHSPFGGTGGVRAKVHDLARSKEAKERREAALDMDPNAPKTPVDLTIPRDEDYERQTQEATKRESNPINFLNPAFWAGEAHRRLMERKVRMQKTAPLTADPNDPHAADDDDGIRTEIEINTPAPRLPGGKPIPMPPEADPRRRQTVVDNNNRGGAGGGNERLEQLLTALLEETRRQTSTLRDGGGMPLPDYYPPDGPMRA